MTPDLSDEVRSVLDTRFAARERAITESRKVIRSAANAIRALHRSEWDEAEALITESGEILAGIGDSLAESPELRMHAVVFDALIYFRRLDSAIRPYLGTGLSVLHFSSDEIAVSAAQGLSPPAGTISSTRVGLRSHVGIDFRLSRLLVFRYSFSETLSGNPISPSLTPPGRRGLMNFQNLFGLVGRF